MSAFADAMNQALIQLDIAQFDLLGYSLGGRAALFFATRYPHAVRRLVLESASPGLPDEAQRTARRAGDARLIERLLHEGIEAFVDQWERTPVLVGQKNLSDSELSKLRTTRLACSAVGLASSLAGMGTGAQRWLGDVLDTLCCPVLFLAGQRDKKFAGIAADMAHGVPGATAVHVADCGHTIHLERPDIFFEVVSDFLAATDDRELTRNAS
jgi:2-succinyl-6-hydroxy-2,4-cyclohexadiene-1-carboxylate synthase